MISPQIYDSPGPGTDPELKRIRLMSCLVEWNAERAFLGYSALNKNPEMLEEARSIDTSFDLKAFGVYCAKVQQAGVMPSASMLKVLPGTATLLNDIAADIHATSGEVYASLERYVGKLM